MRYAREQLDVARAHRRQERRLKAVAVLPSLATLGNLASGCGAIYMCLLSVGSRGGDLLKPTLNSQRLELFFPTYLAIGAYMVLLAMVFDVLDGRLARLFRKTSDFGAQLDSLSDVVSFGVAPLFLVLCMLRSQFGDAAPTGFAKVWWRVDVGMLIIYACCAAIRLARFNVENDADESAHRYFKGLPSPGAAAAVISLVLLHEEFLRESAPGWMSSLVLGIAPPFALMTGLLMISRYKYPHLINTVVGRKRSLIQIVLMVGILVVLASISAQGTYAALACLYACVGPIHHWWAGRMATRERAATNGAN